MNMMSCLSQKTKYWFGLRSAIFKPDISSDAESRDEQDNTKYDQRRLSYGQFYRRLQTVLN